VNAFSIAQEHVRAVEAGGWETAMCRYGHQETGGNSGSSHFIR